MTGAPTGMPPEVARSAIEWWLLHQEEALTEAQRQQWQSWRQADALHEQAWQRIASVNQQLAGLARPQQASIARATLAPRSPAGRRQVVRALAVLAFGAGIAWQLEQRTPWQSWVADARTARGERRQMVLDDGTRIVLNGASALDIDYGPELRRLRLRQGEVLIATAPDQRQPGRAFVVQTPEGTAQALGTRFAVRALPDGGAQVSVFEGAVQLTPGQTHAPALVLQAGQQALLRAQGVSAPEPVHEDSTAWTDGMLVARGMRLSEVLAALQPYSQSTLVCEPGVAGLRVSGTYPLDDVSRVLAVIGALPGLRMRTLTRWWGRQDVVFEAAGPF